MGTALQFIFCGVVLKLLVLSVATAVPGCNVTEQVIQHCHNCVHSKGNMTLDKCKKEEILASEGNKDMSECINVCQNTPKCLGVHYDVLSRNCTYLITCMYLIAGQRGDLYRKSCNKDCPHFTLHVLRFLQPDCNSTTEIKSVTTGQDCLLACADTDGCRQATHHKRSSTCILHPCTDTVKSSKSYAGLFKNCSTPATTTVSTTSSVLTTTSRDAVTTKPTADFGTTATSSNQNKESDTSVLRTTESDTRSTDTTTSVTTTPTAGSPVNVSKWSTTGGATAIQSLLSSTALRTNVMEKKTSIITTQNPVSSVNTSTTVVLNTKVMKTKLQMFSTTSKTNILEATTTQTGKSLRETLTTDVIKTNSQLTTAASQIHIFEVKTVNSTARNDRNTVNAGKKLTPSTNEMKNSSLMSSSTLQLYKGFTDATQTNSTRQTTASPIKTTTSSIATIDVASAKWTMMPTANHLPQSSAILDISETKSKDGTTVNAGCLTTKSTASHIRLRMIIWIIFQVYFVISVF